jgi:alpha-tubulin suppressor-like RCC1 family protein
VFLVALLLAALAFARPASAAPAVTAVGTGTVHSCAVLGDGGALTCWGLDASGAIGTGVPFDDDPTCPWGPCRPTPTPVVGLGAGVTAVGAGGEHTCALTRAGAVWCWGLGTSGQLGTGQRPGGNGAVPTPVRVTGLDRDVQAIATGSEHSCALTTAGAVLCWGANDFGQLGDGTDVDRLAPVPVSGLGSGVTAIAAGQSHSCAVTASGAVKCWGLTTYGAVGNGSPTGPDICSGNQCAATPVAVVGLDHGVRSVTAGNDDTCVLTTAGGVRCWGYGGVGALGNGSDATTYAPADSVVGLDHGVAAVDAGTGNTCALLTTGAVKCWGSNFFGQLGDGSGANSTVPVSVSELDSGVTAISADDSSCAVLATGELRCWGWNAAGQVGDGTTTNRPVPVKVTPPRIPTRVTAAPQLVLFGPPFGIGFDTVQATLTGSGAPLAGRTVTFSVAGLPLCSAVTRIDGVASCRIGLLAELFVLVFNRYTAHFAGNSTYEAATGSTPAVTLVGSATASVARVTVARGKARVRIVGVRRMRPGRYTLRITLSDGRRIRRTVTLGPRG